MTRRLLGHNRFPFARAPRPDELAQPTHRGELPHDEYDGDNEFANGEYPFGHEDGDPRVPEACWGQWGKERQRRHYNPTKQWGDRRLIAVENGNTIPKRNVPSGQPYGGGGTGTNPSQTTYASPNTTLLTGYLVDLKLIIPAVCVVYLSAVDVSGTLSGTNVNIFVEWTVEIGCGRANQSRTLKMLVAPNDNSVITALNIQQPMQTLRVSGQVFDTLVGGANPIFEVECVATCAPFSVVLPENVHS